MIRALERLVAVGALSGCLLLGCAGAGSATTSTAGHDGAAIPAASCPPGGETSIEQLRSTPVRSGVLAPKGTAWTTVCGVNFRGVYFHGALKGGPINAALNSARKMDEVCPMVLRRYEALPILVILRYTTDTRRFIVHMNCPSGVVLHDGNRLTFTEAGNNQAQAAVTTAGT